jgi:hypothetical protein
MKIEVKEEHINYMNCGSAKHCMVNQAVAYFIDTTKFQPYTNGRHISIYNKFEDECLCRLDLPNKVRSKVYEYDSRQHVDPFEFELPIPNEYLKPEFQSS